MKTFALTLPTNRAHMTKLLTSARYHIGELVTIDGVEHVVAMRKMSATGDLHMYTVAPAFRKEDEAL